VATCHLIYHASTSQIESLTLLTERQRIARDLHDTLSQDLVGLIRQLDIVEAHLKVQHSERALTIVQDVAQSARTALTEARWTIENLRTMTADVACPEAILNEICQKYHNLAKTCFYASVGELGDDMCQES
jgi:NarL family two-component system sensor histidine kinase YdfH